MSPVVQSSPVFQSSEWRLSKVSLLRISYLVYTTIGISTAYYLIGNFQRLNLRWTQLQLGQKHSDKTLYCMAGIHDWCMGIEFGNIDCDYKTKSVVW